MIFFISPNSLFFEWLTLFRNYFFGLLITSSQKDHFGSDSELVKNFLKRKNQKFWEFEIKFYWNWKMEFPGQRCLFGIFKKGKDEIVDQTCVMKKILRDERNHKVSFFHIYVWNITYTYIHIISWSTRHTDVFGLSRFLYFHTVTVLMFWKFLFESRFFQKLFFDFFFLMLYITRPAGFSGTYWIAVKMVWTAKTTKNFNVLIGTK